MINFSPYYPFKILRSSGFITESSPEFKSHLTKFGIELEVERLTKYESLLYVNEIENLELEKYYLFIDKNIYKNIYTVLNKSKLSEHINNISYILKAAFYEVQLTYLNKEITKKAFSLTKEIVQLKKKIETKTEFLDITFHSKLKGKDFKIQSPILIELILQQINKSILNSTELKQLFEVEFNIEFSNKRRVKSIENSIIDKAIIDILIYLQLFTKSETNSKEIDGSNGKFKNAQLNLIFELLIAGMIIGDDAKYQELYLVSQADKSPKDYIRSKVKRFMASNPDYQTYFKKGVTADEIFSQFFDNTLKMLNIPQEELLTPRTKVTFTVNGKEIKT